MFKVGDKIKYEPDFFVMVSWRDTKTGALVSGPPENEVGIIESFNEDGDAHIYWPTLNYRECFNIQGSACYSWRLVK